MTKKMKILIGIVAIIAIVGIMITVVAGINIGKSYSTMKQVEIYLAEDVNYEKIKAITDQVFGEQPVTIQTVELFNDQVAITTTEITKEQLNRLVELTNQNFSWQYENTDNITITTIPGLSIIDTVTPFIMPIIVVLVITLAYMAIRFRKLGMVKAVVIPLGIVIGAVVVFYSILAIARIPFNSFVMPMILALIVISLTIIAYKLENTK